MGMSLTRNLNHNICVDSLQPTGRSEYPEALGAGKSGPSTRPETARPASFRTWTQASNHPWSQTLSPDATIGNKKDLAAAAREDL